MKLLQSAALMYMLMPLALTATPAITEIPYSETNGFETWTLPATVLASGSLVQCNGNILEVESDQSTSEDNDTIIVRKVVLTGVNPEALVEKDRQEAVLALGRKLFPGIDIHYNHTLKVTFETKAYKINGHSVSCGCKWEKRSSTNI